MPGNAKTDTVVHAGGYVPTRAQLSAVHQGATGALAVLCAISAFVFTAARPPAWGAGAVLLGLAALGYWLTPARRGSAAIRYGIATLASLAGALLLPSRALVVLIVALAAVDWLRFRPAWSRALPVLANQLLAGAVAHGVFVALAPEVPSSTPSRAVLMAALAGGLALVAVLALQDALATRLAPDAAEPRRARRLAGRLELLAGCAGLGVLAAIAWWVNPPLLALAALPLALLVRALGAALAQPQARVDARTGLPNAAAFRERADEELARGLRFGRPTGLLLVDIDRLGEVSAAHGRGAGGAVLSGMADLLRAQSRTYDIVARLRADRFAVLLPEAGEEELRLVAERIRAAVEREPFLIPASAEPARVTVSIGMARHPQHGEYASALLQAAERGAALVRSQGGNGVALAASGGGAVGVTAAATVAATPAAARPATPRGRQAAEAGDGPAPDRARAAALRAWLVYAYIGLVCLSAVTLFAATFRAPQWSLVPAYGAILLLGITFQFSKIELYGRGYISAGVVVLMVCAVLLGPTPAMLLGIIMAVVRWPWKLPPLKGLLFDSASNALVFGLLALAAPVLDRAVPGPSYLHLGLLGLLLGAATYVLNHGLLVGVMSLSEGTNPFGVWRERFDWMAPHTLAFGVLAAFMTLAYARMGATGLVVFSVPAFMMRFVMKQFVDRTKEHVAALREAHSRLAATNQQLSASVEELERSYNATLTAFSGMLDARDSETEGHSQRVVALALALGRTIGLGPQDLAALEVGALLHDIGKVGVSDAILRKPGPLSDQEWTEMRKHPEIGHRLTEEIPFLQPASPVVRHHHERWDGSGYPDRLRGEDIPLLARIFAVVDAFDAIVSDRPYRRGQSPTRAVAEIQRGTGTQFDPLVVEALVSLAGSEGWLEADKLPERALTPEPTGVTVQNLFGGRLERQARPAADAAYAAPSRDRQVIPGP
ncbi:MAG TPA: diguanylate cyclase [Thermomicrobiales bacterium]|nr:diguanylate cyclase [Thermomicrobiales bacterium]